MINSVQFGQFTVTSAEVTPEGGLVRDPIEACKHEHKQEKRFWRCPGQRPCKDSSILCRGTQLWSLTIAIGCVLLLREGDDNETDPRIANYTGMIYAFAVFVSLFSHRKYKFGMFSQLEHPTIPSYQAPPPEAELVSDTWLGHRSLAEEWIATVESWWICYRFWVAQFAVARKTCSSNYIHKIVTTERWLIILCFNKKVSCFESLKTVPQPMSHGFIGAFLCRTFISQAMRAGHEEVFRTGNYSEVDARKSF